MRQAVVACTALALTTPAAVLALGTTGAGATPVARQVRVANTDWTSAGVGGVGSASVGGGTGTISISGVSGTVTGAYLTWSGIGPNVGSTDFPDYEGTYNNPNITVNGSPVAGTSEGESGSNCWGDTAYSRTYLADVTSIVKAQGGNGNYDLAGLGAGGDANGADLVVTYKDSDTTNNRDLYLYYGNDTDADNYPGEDNVWSDALTDLNYQGGVARLQLGVADGQDFGNPDDGTLNVTGDGGTVAFADDPSNNGLWDGTTVTDAGHSRAPNGSLYDVENFDVTGAFGANGVQDLHLDSDLVNDCHSLDRVAVDIQATGDQPPPPQTVSVSPASVTEGTAPLPKGKVTKMVFKVTLSAKSTTDTTVTLETQDGTATAPDDYRSTTRTITIPAGKRAKTFKVSVIPDSTPESNEAFYAVITSASIPVATNAAVGEIIDDDSVMAAHTKAQVRQATTGGVR